MPALALALCLGVTLASATAASSHHVTASSPQAAHAARAKKTTRTARCTKTASTRAAKAASRRAKSASRGRGAKTCVSKKKTAVRKRKRSSGLIVTSTNAPASLTSASELGAGAVVTNKLHAGADSEGHSEQEGIQQEVNGVLTDPIDPRFLTKVPFGSSSFWLQPWRAYLDTWPSSTLLDSLGINFNVKAADAEAVAQLLQESGFKLARREIPWSSISYEDPDEFVNEAHIDAVLEALHKHDIRPLILLNANSGFPTPAKQISLTTLAAAPAGASTVQLDAASAAEVVPGKTGFDALSFGTGPDILISSVNGADVATLSRPLIAALPAGKHNAMTLRYAPFEAPKLADGQPNPVFEETLDGWLSYVATVTKKAASIFGPEGYDLEVWNELTFGSQFLNSEHYYRTGENGDTPVSSAAVQADAKSEEAETAGEEEDIVPEESTEPRQSSEQLEEAKAGSEPEPGPEAEEGPEAETPEVEAEEAAEADASASPQADSVNAAGKERTVTPVSKIVSKEIRKALLDETVAYVRNPANGIPAGVGITDGFASQTPFPSGADSPLGLTALSKHLYEGAKDYPADYPDDKIKPINALGFRDTLDERGFTPLFVPEYQSLFPEAYLTAQNTETLVRDIAPITTKIYGLPHGRDVGPEGGAPVQKWMTEYNLAPGKAKPMQADGVTPANVTLTSADREHFEAKALLRSLVAMVNKGLSREYFFAAAPGALSLIGKGFYTALEEHPESYPGSALGGETMRGFRNLLSKFQGPGPEGQARQLKLLSIAQEGNHAQFSGDGTAAHPSLYDRDVLAVLPFQASPTHFVIPVYVMTRDLLTLYEPLDPESDVSRFDLPNENFRITLGNLPETSNPPAVSAYDPLSEQSTPARLISRSGGTAEFEVAATDYPRLLSLEYE